MRGSEGMSEVKRTSFACMVTPFPRERLAGLRQRQKIDDHDAASVPIRPGPEEAGGLRVDFRREGGTGACAEQDMKTLLKSLPDGVLALESPGTDTDADRCLLYTSDAADDV